jgi:hypothetical protein
MHNGNAAALQAKTPCSSRTVYQQRMEGKKHLLHSIHHFIGINGKSRRNLCGIKNSSKGVLNDAVKQAYHNCIAKKPAVKSRADNK